jgi:hypothetical protein
MKVERKRKEIMKEIENGKEEKMNKGRKKETNCSDLYDPSRHSDRQSPKRWIFTLLSTRLIVRENFVSFWPTRRENFTLFRNKMPAFLIFPTRANSPLHYANQTG